MKVLGVTIFILSLLSCVLAQEARKIDEFGDLSCDDLTVRVGNLFAEVGELKDSKGYIIVYNGKLSYRSRNNSSNPRFNEAKAEIENIKTRIKFYNFDEKRIVFIEGGFREKFTIELWVIPDNSTLPKLFPTLKKMKYRKGKAEPSCKYI